MMLRAGTAVAVVMAAQTVVAVIVLLLNVVVASRCRTWRTHERRRGRSRWQVAGSQHCYSRASVRAQRTSSALASSVMSVLGASAPPLEALRHQSKAEPRAKLRAHGRGRGEGKGRGKGRGRGEVAAGEGKF